MRITDTSDDALLIGHWEGSWEVELSGIQFTSPLLAPLPQLVKRTVDLALVVWVGVILTPLMLVIAASIKCVSAGPVFYGQERIGRGGKPFRVWKFRTMAVDAEEILEDHLRRHPEHREEWEQVHKLRNDPRIIPRIGRLLRRSSLDELPQLWNVVKGEMTLVGPRPLPRYHLEKLEAEFCGRRHQVTPGVTGLWQVASRTNGAPEMFMKWDCYYIRNWSPWLDVQILLRTPFVVLFGEGAC